MIIGRELEQRRSFLPQGLQVNNFVIGGAGMPALPDDPDPFESQSPDGSVFVFAFGALGVVESAGPERVLDRLSGELVKGLAKELRAEVAPADAELFAAAFDDWSFRVADPNSLKAEAKIAETQIKAKTSKLTV